MTFKALFQGLSLAMVMTFSSVWADEPVAADAIYMNGNIWTGAADNTPAEAIAIRAGVIIAVGSDADMEVFTAPTTRMVDLHGARVLPGLIDSHTHFLPSGIQLGELQLRDVTTREEFIRRIREKAASLPKGAWITGGSWDHELWGGETPAKEWIDSITPDNPVYLVRHAGHMAFVNSLALKLAGVDANTQDPAGGKVVRDEKGEPTGIVKESAQDLIRAAIPPSSHEELDRAFDRAQALALSYGITQIHDVHDWESFETFLRARDRGALKLRVYCMTELEHWQRMADYVTAHGRGDNRLWWGGLKGYVDGALGATTAWFYDPYTDAPETSGMARHGLDDLRSWIAGADAAGLQVAVHAIGDRAIDWLFDTYQAVEKKDGARDRRFRIEHAQHLSKTALPRFAAQGVIAAMQPYHAIDDGRWAEKRIGADRIKRTYAFRSLLDAGATVAFGSDWYVAPLDPMTGIYAAVTRRTTDGANPDGWVPNEKISLEEALTAYTATAAYAGFREEVLGTLEPGKLADFVVLSKDIFEIDPEEIQNIRVLRTVIQGQDEYVAN